MSSFLRLAMPAVAVLAAALSAGATAPAHAAALSEGYAAANKTRHFVLTMKGTGLQRMIDFVEPMYGEDDWAKYFRLAIQDAFAVEGDQITRTSDVISGGTNDNATRQLITRFTIAPRANVSLYSYNTQEEATANAGGINATAFLASAGQQPTWLMWIQSVRFYSEHGIGAARLAAAASFTLPNEIEIVSATLDPRDPAYKGAAPSVFAGGFAAAVAAIACAVAAAAL